MNSEDEEVKDNHKVMHMEDTSSYIVKKRRPSLIRRRNEKRNPNETVMAALANYYIFDVLCIILNVYQSYV